MSWSAILDGIFRWIHVVAGIIWIGHLYFFNFVNAPFEGKLDADSKKKVVPELRPRALYWFRWGAAWTWLSGVALAIIVFYHGGAVSARAAKGEWDASIAIVIAVTFLGAIVYDITLKTTTLKNNKVLFWVGFAVSSGLYVAFSYLLADSDLKGTLPDFRGATIHLGMLFGTTMALNVWMRIWPAQKQIITAIKNGQPPDPALVAMAGGRSRHNVYMSVPLIFAMMNAHQTWAAPGRDFPFIFPLLILLSWGVVFLLYKKAAKVQGF